MAYKAAYQPSSLLDPSTNVWYSWDHCKKYLDVDTHAAFSAPLVPKVPRESSPEVVEVMEEEVEQSEGEGDSEEGDDTVLWPPVPPPGCLDPSSLHKSIIMGTVLLESKSLVPLMVSPSSILSLSFTDRVYSSRQRGRRKRRRWRFDVVSLRWEKDSVDE
jgi:hypothetical protein